MSQVLKHGTSFILAQVGHDVIAVVGIGAVYVLLLVARGQRDEYRGQQYGHLLHHAVRVVWLMMMPSLM